MTRNHIFPVFYREWNETCAKPQNFVSGFRSHADENFRVEKPRVESQITEKVCLMRALTIVEKELDGQTLELFHTRFKNGYDVVVDSDPERLWCIYSNLRRSVEENAP